MILESLEKCLQTKAANQTDLTQLRGQKRTMTICTVKNGIVEEFSSVNLNGVGIRVLVDDKSWGFSSTNLLTPKSIENTLANAVKLAKAASNLKKQKIPGWLQ
jgi:predicted Zn-dependent protease